MSTTKPKNPKTLWKWDWGKNWALNWAAIVIITVDVVEKDALAIAILVICFDVTWNGTLLTG